MPDTFDTLRPYLADYLRARGIDPRRRFRCLNPDHLDRNPSMAYDARRHKVHCFACGADYDLFDLLTIDRSYSSPLEALAEASRLYGHGDVTVSRPVPEPVRRATDGRGGESRSAARTERGDLTMTAEQTAAYITSCAANRTKTDYFSSRGISEQTAARFSLGYDGALSCVVLPCDGGHVVRRATAEKRYLNEKGQPSPLFQSALLRGDEPAFLVEGVFDALSAEELGFRACAMNGSGNRTKIAAILRTLAPYAPILLLPDNDRAGDEWATALTDEFPWLYRCPPLPEGKDLNELLCADAGEAADFLTRCLTDRLAHLPPAYDTLSAGAQMDALDAYIAQQAARPALSTGFPALDRALDGGLYDGFYVLGAISSLGKTAFCMQLADQLAQQGRDVLIFSLEMTAFELMARSVSRETFLADATAKKSLSKTVRGVLDGKRYPHYPPAEITHLAEAKARYGSYAKHLWFREGDHETSLDFIRAEVARHIRETGVRPVVLIDYLQIIAPVDVHFTDKQNLDRIVCSLKKLSREQELTILAISSFNRENYNMEVSMSAFKESGGIDYSADVLIGLQAKGAGKPGFNIDEAKRADPREIELRILKNRSAAIPQPIAYRYYPAFSCFEEL